MGPEGSALAIAKFAGLEIFESTIRPATRSIVYVIRAVRTRPEAAIIFSLIPG